MMLVAALNAGELTPAIFSKREKFLQKNGNKFPRYFTGILSPILKNFVVGFH
jgi:hypothetical protein